MNNNAQSVKDKLKTIAKQRNVDFNLVMRFYMYDRFMERLVTSKYKNNFILKGGFYLSKLFGIDNRNTIDIDIAIQNTELDKENIKNIINEILNIDTNDNVIFLLEEITPIREEDEYGGLRVTVIFKLDNIKDKFHIDIATGDPIYPGPKYYNYQTLINNKEYKVLTYSIETILAEKIETILSKLEKSSRMKDYYDIYMIYKFEFERINKNNLKIAIEKTFKKRDFNQNPIKNIEIIKSSEILKMKWKSYTLKNKYAKNIDFNETIKCLEQFIKIIDVVTT